MIACGGICHAILLVVSDLLMHPELLITNIGFLLSAILTLSLGFFVWLKGKRQPVNIVFFLFSISVSIFELSHMIGVNIADPDKSRLFFMFNINNVFIASLTAHWVFAIIGKLKEQKKAIIVMYALAFSLLIFFISFPDLFMLPSKPYLYFKNYYVTGKLYWLNSAFLYLVVIYFMYHIIKAYRSADFELKNRLRYSLVGLFFGYIIGSIPVLPIYGIYIDPILSIFIGLYTVPIAYGIIKYDLLDIKIAAKRAVMYAFLVALVGIFITGISFLNQFIVSRAQGLPIWIIPLLTSSVAVFIGALVWSKLKEVDILKYEFITIVTHKFRTPLTHIKWSAEELAEAQTKEEKKQALADIWHSSEKLMELTNVLIGASDDENSEYVYTKTTTNLEGVINIVVSQFKPKYNNKQVGINFIVLGETPTVNIDQKRFKFVLFTLLDNALLYTPKLGRVHIILETVGKKAILSIKDSGKGIDKKTLPYIFSRFYRSTQAKIVDTEGVGVGLFISKKIVERHNGTIKVFSEGNGAGTTFVIKLPIVKK